MPELESKVQFFTLENEGIEKGVYFRFPLQKVYKESFSFNDENECVSGWRNRAIKQVIPFLLNIRMWFKCKEWLEEDDFAGIRVKELCSPIYFIRKVRTATHKILNHPFITEINVYGYEPYKNYCAGAAEREVTIIKFKDNSKNRVVKYEKFHYVYAHVVEQELKQGLTKCF